MAVPQVKDTSFTCPECGFALWHPIAELGCSILGLYDDARFPGRCLLVFARHVDDFAELDENDTLAFVREAQHVARVLSDVTGAERVNYAILGNAESHLHFHLIPRARERDAIPGKSPWSHPDPVSLLPDPVSLLPAHEREDLIARIAAALTA